MIILVVSFRQQTFFHDKTFTQLPTPFRCTIGSVSEWSTFVYPGRKHQQQYMIIHGDASSGQLNIPVQEYRVFTQSYWFGIQAWNDNEEEHQDREPPDQQFFQSHLANVTKRTTASAYTVVSIADVDSVTALRQVKEELLTGGRVKSTDVITVIKSDKLGKPFKSGLTSAMELGVIGYHSETGRRVQRHFIGAHQSRGQSNVFTSWTKKRKSRFRGKVVNETEQDGGFWCVHYTYPPVHTVIGTYIQ